MSEGNIENKSSKCRPRNQISAEKIPEEYISEKVLERCLERKGWFCRGWVKGYRKTDPDSTSCTPRGWAVWGQKKVKLSKSIWYLFYSNYPGTERTSYLVLSQGFCQTQSQG